MAYAGIGMLAALCLGAGGVLGWFADSALGTLPLFLLFGLVAGAGAGVLGALGRAASLQELTSPCIMAWPCEQTEPQSRRFATDGTS